MRVRVTPGIGRAPARISRFREFPDCALVMASACLKILIVDDAQAMRQMIREAVGDLGVEMFEASSGEEGLQQFRLNRPDVVLMDLSMPGMSGLEATRLLKAEFPNSRVMIVTQNDSEPLRRAAQGAGAWAYFLKENLHEVRECIQKFSCLQFFCL